MSDKKILVSGIEINFESMSDEQLLKLYNQLLERQILIEQKSKKYAKNDK